MLHLGAQPHAWRQPLLVGYLIAEGVLSPLIMPAMLPDMLDSTRPEHLRWQNMQVTVDEHTTNLVRGLLFRVVESEVLLK